MPVRKPWDFGFKPSHFEKELLSVGATKEGIRAADKLFDATLRVPRVRVSEAVVKRVSTLTVDLDLRAFLRGAKPYADITVSPHELKEITRTLKEHHVPFKLHGDPINRKTMYFKTYADAKKAAELLEENGISHKKRNIAESYFEHHKDWDWWDEQESFMDDLGVPGYEPNIRVGDEDTEKVGELLRKAKVAFKYQKAQPYIALGDPKLEKVWDSIDHDSLGRVDCDVLHGIRYGYPLGDIIGYIKRDEPHELVHEVDRVYDVHPSTLFSYARYWPKKWREGIDRDHLAKLIELWSR
jgi:hypothetical protein